MIYVDNFDETVISYFIFDYINNHIKNNRNNNTYEIASKMT